MTPKALKALKGSIRKWERILIGKDSDQGAKNCPLCKEYFYSYRCRGCPIFNKTGERFCEGTPYYDFISTKVQNEDDLLIAYRELTFLRSLLPAKRQ